MSLVDLSAHDEPTWPAAMLIRRAGDGPRVSGPMRRPDTTHSGMSRRRAGLVVDRRDTQTVRSRIMQDLPGHLRALRVGAWVEGGMA